MLKLLIALLRSFIQFVLLLIALAYSNTAHGQATPKSPVQEPISLNEEHIDSLINICITQRITNEDKLKSYGNQIKQYSLAANDEYRLCYGHYALGVHYYITSQIDSALHDLYLAYNLSREVGNVELQANTANFIGLSYQVLGQHGLSYSFQQELLSYGESANDPSIQGNALNNIASIFYQTDEFEKSLEIQHRALDLLKIGRLSDGEDVLWAYRALAQSYQGKGEKVKAVEYYLKALSLGNKLKFDRAKLWTLQSLIDFYYTEDLELAKFYLDQAMDITKNLEDGSVKAEILLLSARISEKSGKRAKAIETLEDALKITAGKDLKQQERRILHLIISLSQDNSNDKKLKYLEMLESSISDDDKDFRIKSLTIWADNQKLIVDQQQENLLLKQAEYEQSKAIHNTRIGLIGSFIALFTLVMYLFNTKKINRLSAEHNERLTEKNKSISDQLDIIGQQKIDLEVANQAIQTEKSKLKNKLAQKMIHIANEQEMLASISKVVEDVELPKSDKQQINKLIGSYKKETIWEEFDLEFAESNQAFFASLAKAGHKLTASDYRLAAMIKMNLENKEMARLLSKSVESIHMAQSRLRKKLDLDRASTNLITYFNSLTSESENSPDPST